MTAVRRVLRAQLARRTAPVLLLALVVAVIVGVVVAGVGGARRTASVVDRLDDRSHTTDVLVRGLSGELATDTDAGMALVRGIEQVDGVESAALSVAFPIDAVPDDYFMVTTSPDGAGYLDVDRPIVREGRLPAPDSPDEVAVNQRAVEALDLHVGDTVSGPTLANEDAAAAFSEEGGFPGFRGPETSVTVVGVVDLPWQLAARKGYIGPGGIASPAFAEAHREEFASYVTNVAVTTDDASPELLQQLAQTGGEVVDGEVNVLTADAQWRAPLRDAARTVAVTIAVIALFAAAASFLVAVLWIGREVQLAGANGPTLDALGMTRRERALVAGGPSCVAVAIGAPLGIVVAVLLSGRFPIGSVRAVEVRPGIRFDLVAVIAGVAVALLLAGAALVQARRRSGDSAEFPSRRALVATRLGQLGLAPSTAIGIDVALDRQPGQRGVPTRSAVAGAVVAVMGVAAIVVLGNAATTMADEPARYGVTWSALPDLLAEDQDAAVAATMANPLVVGGADVRITQVAVGGHLRPAMSFDALGDLDLVLTDGRMPADDSEAVVSDELAAREGLAVGAPLTLDDPQGAEPTTVSVVGTMIGPPIDDQPREVLLTADALERYGQTAASGYPALRYADGVDRATVEADLAPLGWRFTDSSEPQAPSQVEQFRTARGLFLGALVLVALLGAAGLLHVLAVSARRRRGDLAVLQALGFFRRDVRHVLTAQALAATVVGVVIGIPLGIVAGRVLWHLAVDDLGLADDIGLPWALLAVIALVALVGAVLLSLPIGRAAGRRPIAATLRAE